MATREGRWDCQYCGTTAILGRHKACPNCARSRPEGTKFYLPSDEAEVSASDLLEQARVGPDWICAFCSSSNPADANVCRHCNAPQEETSARQATTDYAVGEVPRSGDMDLDTPPERPKPVVRARSRRWPLAAVAGGAAVLLVCLALVFLLFRTSDKPVTIDHFEWERTIEVEDLRTVTEEDWQVPSAGRLLSQREAIREYEQVLRGYETKQREVAEQVQVGERIYVCGQRDLGNGFFEDIECSDPIYETQYRTETYEEPIYEQVPVYGTLYTFEINRWMEDRTERAAGNTQEAYWPQLVLATGEREGERTEEYAIVFVDEDGETYTMEFELDEWLAFEPQGTYNLEVNALGDPVEVMP